MGNINMIKDGSGIEFTAFINGWKEHFKLCIIRRKDWNKEEFAFINDDKTKVIDSVYTGGSTGFGTDDRSIKDPTTWELVTDDLDEIMNIAEKKDIAEKKEREEFLNKQQTRTDMINALPKLIPTGIEFLNKMSTGSLTLIKELLMQLVNKQTELENEIRKIKKS